MERTPDGIAFLVAQDKSVSALDDFAGEDEVRFALLDFLLWRGRLIVNSAYESVCGLNFKPPQAIRPEPSE